MSDRPDATKEPNPQQTLFVDNYMRDMNATRAYVEVYGAPPSSARRSAYRLLRKPYIAALVDRRKAERAAAMKVDADYVVRNLREVIERCMQRAPVMEGHGRDRHQLVDEQGRDVWQFDSRGAVAALALLAKHVGGFTDKHEVSGPDGTPLPVAVTVTRRIVQARP